MAIITGLRAEQSLSTVLTRQGIQSVEILQFGHEDLQRFLLEQAEKNPLIALRPSAGGVAGSLRRTASAGSRHEGDFRSAAESRDYKTSLREHLHSQLGMSSAKTPHSRLVSYLIDSLEPDGYLRQDLEEISELLEAPRSGVEIALRILQSFEPAGVGARCLGECLKLQLLDQGLLSPAFERLLNNLQLILDGNRQKIAKICGVRHEDIPPMLNTLKRLSPAPGHSFEWEPILPALPDIVVDFPNGALTVALNPALTPRLLLDRNYYVKLAANTFDLQERRYLSQCYQDATFLVKSLDQRARTMLRIATKIVTYQQSFFTEGINGLRPLSQKAIAQAIGAHESTVSRAIANKYVLCAHGLFALKFFCSDGSCGPGQDEVAPKVIRHKIKGLIEKEADDNVLSDDAICALLQRDGISIARRTVAKYRQQMNIGTSTERRRQLLFAIS